MWNSPNVFLFFSQEIFDIAKEFLKIEKVEFGGPKGKVLGASVSAVYR